MADHDATLPGPTLEQVGKAFRALREERHMSVEVLATETGRSARQIEAVEKGTDDLRLDLFIDLTEALGVGLAAPLVRAEGEEP